MGIASIKFFVTETVPVLSIKRLFSVFEVAYVKFIHIMNERKNANVRRRITLRIPEKCREGFIQYTVVSGDTMFNIAKRFNISLEFLIVENPHITDPSVLFPGDVLCVPRQVSPPRIPESCPVGYDRYEVKPGDTVYKIAQRLGVPIDLIIVNNPHIPDPSIIFPGDVLCVPSAIIFPSCTVLKAVGGDINQDTFGSAVVQRLVSGKHSLGILGVNLPEPSSLGDFDIYDGFIWIQGIGGFGFGLSPLPEQPGTWAGTIELEPLLTKGNKIYIIPGNSQTGISGEPILTGSF